MQAAREGGITFLDDARYNDETGRAPIPTGYSEVVFGELFRAAGWRRDDTVVANKLWWEFWPDETPAQELAGSLGRMGLDTRPDLLGACRPRRAAGGRRRDDRRADPAGHARAWGTLNWPPALIELAWQLAGRRGSAGPCGDAAAVQPGHAQGVEDPEMQRVRGTGGSRSWPRTRWPAAS